MRYKEECHGESKFSTKTVAAEIAALPADMQARFVRLAERIASVGLESLSEPHVVRAFVKKTQKTPRAEIELALRRAKDVT